MLEDNGSPLMNKQYLSAGGRYRPARTPLGVNQVAGHFGHPLLGLDQDRPNVIQNALVSLTLAVSFGQAMIFCIAQLVINSLICQELRGLIIAVHLILRLNSLPDALFFLSEIIKQRINNVRDSSVTQPVLEAIILRLPLLI